MFGGELSLLLPRDSWPTSFDFRLLTRRWSDRSFASASLAGAVEWVVMALDSSLGELEGLDEEYLRDRTGKERDELVNQAW